MFIDGGNRLFHGGDLGTSSSYGYLEFLFYCNGNLNYLIESTCL
jgi:hypothetical protein